MDTTWLQMKAVLDREMPQDKEKRRMLWVSWRSTGTILAVALLFTSIFYYSYNKSADRINSSLKEKNNVIKAGKESKAVQDPSKPFNKKSVLLGDDNNEEFLALINSGNSTVIAAPKSIPFYQSIATGSKSVITKNNSGNSNRLLVQTFYPSTNH